MFDKFKREVRARQYFTTAEEARFFEHAAKEVADGDIHPGLHAMALSKCEGDEVKANAMYLQLRVDVFKQEAAVGEKILEAAQREAEAEERKAEAAERMPEAPLSGAQTNMGDGLILFVFFLLLAFPLVMGWLAVFG